ncbi:MAG TPA: DUF1223 domain-containing protein [Pyrinomonadaceae bacterium]|nr:DUF1223 domain-containing protein [Pyrinomonadaceae bacterium]
MRSIRTFIASSILIILVGLSFAQSGKRTPVIVELFTSEGCSTCPPADSFLQKLEREQPVDGVEIIALQEHVDYWNRHGWTDPFSSPQFSNRQGYYAEHFKYPEIFTPNMVVDGTLELRGKDGKRPIVDAAKTRKGTLDLTVEGKGPTRVLVEIYVADLPKMPEGDKAVVLLAITEDDLRSSVSAGENKGSVFRHRAVTRSLKRIGDIEGNAFAMKMELPLASTWKRSDLNFIAFVQEIRSRRITAAAKVSLKTAPK